MKYVSVAAGWLAACVVVLAGCSRESDREFIASARTYLSKGEPKAAIVELKNALQKNLQSGEARYLLGKSLLEVGDAAAASVELEKARSLKYPDVEVIPALARAMMLQGQSSRVIELYRSVTFSDRAASADLESTIATAYATQGDREKAATIVAAVLTATPGYAPANLLQARLKASTGDVRGALSQVDGVAAQEPKNYEAWQLKGDLLSLSKGDPSAVVDAYKKSLSIKNDYLPAHVAIVSYLLNQNEIDQASAQFGAMKKVFPSRSETKYFEAQFAFLRQDYKAAQEIIQQLFKVDPDNVKLLQFAGTIEFQRNSLLQAENYLSKALQASPDLLLARRILAQTYLREGQPDKALTALRPRIEAASPDPESLALAGEAYLQSGDVANAQAYFQRAAQLNPNDTKVRTALALTELTKGNTDRGFGDLQAVAASDSGTFADLAMISARLGRNELDAALLAIDALEKKLPSKPFAAALRGRTLLMRNDVAGARASFERALAVDPLYLPATASLAAIDLAENKPEEAKKRFAELLRVDPGNYRALLAMADLGQRTGASPEEVASQLLQAVKLNPTEPAPRLVLVNHYLANHEPKLARTAAQDAVAILPDNPELLDAMGRAQLANGDVQQAIAGYKKLAALQPKATDPLLRLSDIYVSLKDHDGARQSLKRALDLVPNLLSAQRGLITLALAEGRPDEALALAQTIEKQRPKDSTGYMLQGDIETGRKRWDAAFAAYRAGLENAGTSALLASKLHIALRASGKRVEADKFADEWQREHPSDTAFVFYLGDAALGRGDFATAEARYRAVLKLQPNDALALNNVAAVLMKQKKPGASPLAEKANTILPNRPALMDTLATALAEENQFARALEIQKKAVALDPDDASLRLDLARLYVRSGDKAQGKAELERLAALGERFAGQAEVVQLMKSL